MKTETPNAVDIIARELGHGASSPTQSVSGQRLAGRRGWIISDGMAGHLAITRGVAEALGLAVEIKPVAPRAPWRHLAPLGPADPRILRALQAELLPDIVLGAGRQTVPVVRALKRAGAFTVLFQSPRASSASAHVIWVPAHDRLRGPNVIATLTPPHRFTAQTLAALRRETPPEIVALPSPRVALLLGGPGAGYSFDAPTIASFEAQLATLAESAGSFLITPSRRTPPALLQAAERATSAKPRILWDGKGDNPYPQFLASADAFVVTADSVNMTGEACATGRPVYILAPPGGRAKFRRFHEALRAHGATCALADALAGLAGCSYEPVSAAERVAAEIEARWRAFRSTTIDR
ncbi:MAG: mitochondrial fission ELM1 family protein [Rhodomicrobiaceae bacterium]